MNKNKIKLCTIIILNDVPEVIVDVILNYIDINDKFAAEIENALLEFSSIENLHKKKQGAVTDKSKL